MPSCILNQLGGCLGPSVDERLESSLKYALEFKTGPKYSTGMIRSLNRRVHNPDLQQPKHLKESEQQ